MNFSRILNSASLIGTIESSSWVTFWVAVIASTGGVFVLVGLWMEMGVEKERFKNLKDFRRQHRKEKAGMWLVMVGVLIEVFTGAGLAIHDATDNMSIAKQTNDLRIAQTRSEENMQVIQAVMGMRAGDLSKSFPLGYSLALLSGTGQPLIPFVDPAGASIVKDWNEFRFLDMNEAGLKIQLPDIVLSGTTVKMNENSVWLENLPVTGGVQIPFSTTEPCNVSHADLSRYFDVNIFPNPNFVLWIGLIHIKDGQDVIALGIGRPGDRSP